jgi:hypothetical protein
MAVTLLTMTVGLLQTISHSPRTRLKQLPCNKYAVDLDVMKARSHMSASDSSNRARDAAFKNSLLRQDASFIFTNKPPMICHIIPFHEYDKVAPRPLPSVYLNNRFIQWFDLTVKNRPAADEDTSISTLTTVNDLRKGMLLGVEAHVMAEAGQVVVLKVRCLFAAIPDSLI